MKQNDYHQAHDEIFSLSSEYGIDVDNDFFQQVISSLKKENGKSFVQLFIPLFPEQSLSFLKKLKQAANYYLISLLITDHILDEKSAVVSKNGLMIAFLLREKALHLMYELFASDSAYWSYFDQYYREYIIAVQTENKYFFDQVQVKEMTLDEMTTIYAGKSSLAKAVTTALAVKSKKLHLIAPLEKSIDNFYIALNLKDDVSDWKQDIQNEQYSYVISRVLCSNNLKIGQFDHQIFGKHMFFSGEAVNTLQLSCGFFQQSIDAVSSIDCPDWCSAISKSLQLCLHLKNDIEMLVSKELTILGANTMTKQQVPSIKIKLPIDNNIVSPIIINSLNYIFEQWNNGYEEVKAYCYFPDNKGFRFKNRYAVGDVFQRAIICELFQDMFPLSNGSLLPYITFETKYLANCQSEHGGWNFFSNLDYQPCDADTTSQVVKVLLNQGKRDDISNKTIDELDQWLSQNSLSEGYFSSWFIPPVDKCKPHQLKQRDFFNNYVTHSIDTSIDVEVMANVYDMLNLLDPVKYKNNIDIGMKFLINEQQTDGSWLGTWYYGSYYATYVCSKLLAKLLPDDGSLERVHLFIINTQNDDGGWGWSHKKSDPLNTALALLCLYTVNCEVDDKILQNAVNYLKQAVNDSNQMKSCYYINYRKQGLSFFRSNCISYAYIIKALWLWIEKIL